MHGPMGAVITALWLSMGFLSFTLAQEFQWAYQPVYAPGITDACYRALNSTLDCPMALLGASLEEPRALNPNQTKSICTPSCLESLVDAQKAAAKACTDDADVIWDSQKLVAIPATWKIDRLVHGFKAACVTDSISGELCASVLDDWEPDDTKNRDCSPCALDMLAAKLESPLRYSEEEASKLNSIASSCNKTEYTITPPASMFLNRTHPDRILWNMYESAPVPTWASNCKRVYKVRPDETYNSIAAEANVSVFWLQASEYNPNEDFDKALQIGTTLCLPNTSCDIYTVKEDEICDNIISKNTLQINKMQLEAWNPNISSMCNDPSRLNGSVICISPPMAPTPRQGAAKSPKATTFTGCLNKWDRIWPSRSYSSCCCPLAPCRCTLPPRTTAPALSPSPSSACTTHGGSPFAEGDCTPSVSAPVVTTTATMTKVEAGES